MNNEIRYVLRCQTPNGHKWRVEILYTGTSPLYKIRVFETDIQDKEVPLKLDVRSLFLYGWQGTWPPEQVLRLYNDGDSIVIEYRDVWIPFERPILPFKYDVESEWRACFDPQKRSWHLKRVRHLDYEGVDYNLSTEPDDFKNLK